MVICIVSTIIYSLKPETTTMISLFTIAGFLGYFFSKNASTSIEKIDITRRFSSCFFGMGNAVIFVLVLLFTFITASLQENEHLLLIFNTFFKIGSLVIGGGHVILPLMYSEFSSTGDHLTEEDYFNGFSLISVMPGPMFNLSVYIGAMIKKGLWGAFTGSLSAFIGLYLPCFLFLLFVLPYWVQYRKY